MMYKSLSGLVLFLGCAGTAMAVTTTAPTTIPTGVTLSIPPTTGLWTVGIEAEFMMPLDNFQFMSAVSTQAPDTIHYESVDNQKDFGWGADLAYQFADTGRDIRVSYTDLNMSDTEDYNRSPGLSMSGPGGIASGLYFPESDLATGVATYRYRSSDLTVGQLLDVGSRLSFHPFAGLRYAFINVIGDADYQDLESNTANFNSSSKFNGLGPRAGMDVTVNLWKGFSVVGTVGTAILAGDMDENYQVNATNYEGVDKLSIVPEIDGSVGLQYQHRMTDKTNFAGQLGVQAVNYFNADQHDFDDTLYTNSENNSQSFGYHGFYFRAQMSVV